MRSIVVGQKERVGKWVAERVGNQLEWHDFEAFGVEVDGELIGGVVVEEYVENTRCSMHCAGEGKRWLGKEFLGAVFDYVFGQLRCKVAIAPVDSENTTAMKMLTQLGFEEKCRITEGSLRGDLVIFTMYSSGCRWLKQQES